MRRLTLIWILLFLPVVALAGKMVKVKVQKSTIFQEPNFLSSAVASVEYGAQLEMLDELRDWIHVKFEGRRGWIHKSSLTSSTFNLGTIFVGTSSSSASHDEVAMASLEASGYDPVKFRHLLGALEAAQSRESGGVLSTHPNITDRITKVKKGLEMAEGSLPSPDRIARFKGIAGSW